MLLLDVRRAEQAGARGADPAQSSGVMAPSWPAGSPGVGVPEQLWDVLRTSSIPRQLHQSHPDIMMHWQRDSATNPAGAALSSPPLHTGQFPDVNKISSLQEPTFTLSHRSGKLWNPWDLFLRLPITLSGRDEPNHSWNTTVANWG